MQTNQSNIAGSDDEECGNEEEGDANSKKARMVEVHELAIPIALAGDGKGKEQQRGEWANPGEQTGQTSGMGLLGTVGMDAGEMVEGNE